MSLNEICKITGGKRLHEEMFLLEIACPEEPEPGQFVMVSTADNRSDPFLPRPISVFNWENGILTLLIKIVGRGTALLSEMKPGDEIRVVGHLGNSFPDSSGTVVFVGGGIGIAPLLYTAKHSKAAKKLFVLGFQNKNQVILESCFAEYGDVQIVTDDGSYSFKGYPHEWLAARYAQGFKPDLVLSTGPEMMMRAVHKVSKGIAGADYHSLEARMGCGIGACLGCRIELEGGSFLVCKDGPVFNGNEIFEEK